MQSSALHLAVFLLLAPGIFGTLQWYVPTWHRSSQIAILAEFNTEKLPVLGVYKLVPAPGMASLAEFAQTMPAAIADRLVWLVSCLLLLLTLGSVGWVWRMRRQVKQLGIIRHELQQEIVERQAVEKSLRDSEERFSKAFHANPIPMGIVRLSDGTHIELNESAVQLSGHTRAELLGKNSMGFGLGIDPAVSKQAYDNLCADGSVRNIEFQFHLKSVPHVALYSGEVITLNGERCVLWTLQDITERKQAEAARRASELRYRHLVEDQTDFIVRWTPDGTLTFVNDSYCRCFGLPREAAVGTSWFDSAFVIDAKLLVEQMAQLSPANPINQWEHQGLMLDGKMMWTHWINRAFFDEAGNVIEYQSAGRDITAQKQAIQLLAASEARFRALAEASQAAILITQAARYVYANPAAETIFGYTPAELLQLDHYWSMVHPDSMHVLKEFKEKRERGEKLMRRAEVQIIRKDGMLRWLDFAFGEIEIEGKPFSITTVYDITERKQIEEEVGTSREQLRSLAAHLQAIREEDRVMMAREIHDELGQALTGIKMDLKWLEQLLPPGLDEVKRRLDAVFGLINTTIQSVRRLATQLRPGVLDDFGLVAAIEWQAHEYEMRTGIICELQGLPADLPLDNNSATAIFRIFQETLTNIARHAAATHISVRLKSDGAMLSLEIHDNGKGITVDEIKNTSSLGLVGMKERALLLGGNFSIKGTAGLGTIVKVQIPINKER